MGRAAGTLATKLSRKMKWGDAFELHMIRKHQSIRTLSLNAFGFLTVLVVFQFFRTEFDPSLESLHGAMNLDIPAAAPGRRLKIALVHDIIPMGNSGSDHRLIGIASELKALHHDVWIIGRDDRKAADLGGKAMLDRLGFRHFSGLRKNLNRTERFLARRKFDVIVYCMWFWFPDQLYISVPSFFLPSIQNMTWLSPRPLHVILSDDANSHREFLLSALRPDDESKRPDEPSREECNKMAVTIREHEVAMFSRADAVITITEEDSARIRSLPIPSNRIPPISIVPFVRRPYVGSLAPFKVRQGLSFVGPAINPTNGLSMRHFFIDTWPALSSKLPNTTLSIYGGNDAYVRGHTWKTLINATVDEKYRTRVKILGYQESLHEAMNRTRVFIAPIYASTGVITKILDAWRHGVPTVTTPFGLQGYNLTSDGKDDKGNQVVLVATSPEEMVRHCHSLYTDEGLWKAVSRNSLAHSRKFGPELLTRSVRETLGLWNKLIDQVQTTES